MSVLLLLSDMCTDEIITDEVIEKLFVEVASFFASTNSEVVELSGLTSSLVHNEKIEVVFQTLGFKIEYPENFENVMRIRRI